MSGIIKTTDNSQLVGLLTNTYPDGQYWTGDNRFFGNLNLNSSTKNSLQVGGRINQWLGQATNSVQYGDSNSLQYATSICICTTAIGNGTLTSVTSARCNTGIGQSVLPYLTVGEFNVGLGQYVGTSIITGSYNTLLGTYANVASDAYHNSTCIGYNSRITASNQVTLGTVTETVLIPNVLTTQGLVYETVNTCGQTTNALSFSYATGGIFAVGTTITANATLAVTNIPTDTTKSYTFSVVYQQPTTRFYISTVKFQDTASAYIIGSAGTFVAPLFNGGTPSLTGSTNCIIVQQFTIVSVGGTRYVTSSVSCCS